MHIFLAQLTFAPKAVIAIVVIFFLSFACFYVVPALRVGRAMRRARHIIQALSTDSQHLDKRGVGEQLAYSKPLKHAWNEYAETLHEQYGQREGERRLLRLRATVPAEAFFNTAVLVDTPLRTEFFKHLPGILTGIGIIGTFWGLIVGLQHFNVDTDSRALQQNLALLLHGVREAFIASGIAIFAAMVITLVEKGLLNWCYQQAGSLAKTIDTLYETGAGEEYLSRLVDATEESAVQTRHLKEALVNDLKELLTNFSASLAQAIEHSLQQHSQRLITAQGSAHVELSTAFTEAVTRSLHEPMQTIANATRTLGGNQGEALNDLLSATLAKLEGTFGDQMRSLNGMMAGSAESMRNMQAGFQQLLDKFETAGANANTALAEQLRQLAAEAEERQRAMNSTLLGLLDQLRATMTQTQQEGATKLTESLAGITTVVERLMGDLAKQRQAMDESGRQSLDHLREGLAALLETIRAFSAKTSDLYGAELQKLFAQVESRQQELNTQARSLIEQIQRDQEIRQTAIGANLQETLAAIHAQMKVAGEHSVQREQARDQATTVLLEQLAGSVHSLSTAVERGIAAMDATVQRLETISINGADSLTRGAGAIGAAASGMSEAGNRIGQVLERTAEVQGQIVLTTQSLGENSRTLREVLNSYQEQRTRLEGMVSTLRGLIEDANHRAGMSRELVGDMQRMTGNVHSLLVDLADHITQVNAALTQGFDSFADAVTRNMGRVRGEFDQQLSQAVGLVSTQVQELDSALDQLVRTIGTRLN